MTECERIIEQGILPASFFEEEVRCNFLIDKKRKKLWAILLDMLSEIDRVCTENDLTYYLSSGTLLGAIRHKGFIPWDDDIDIAMPRSDYEKLIQLRSKFKYPFIVQTPYTENGYFMSFARVCNINTTFASEIFIYNNYRQGCFIDIFPYDNYNPIGNEKLFDKIKFLARCLGMVMKKTNPHFTAIEEDIEKELWLRSPFEIYDEIQALAKNAGNEDGPYITSLVSTLSRYEKKMYPIDCFKNIIRVPFENMELPVPAGYDIMLKLQYGDYMQFPPIEKRGQWHSNFIYEPDIPFDDYRKKYF